MMQGTGGTVVARNTGSREGTPREPSAMLDVKTVAVLLDCSPRHVYRLADMGRMPRPVKLGGLVRWSRETILNWIGQDCPDCQESNRREVGR